MLHNHQGFSQRRLCNISKISINSIESGIRAVTNLAYGWLTFFLNKICMSIDISQYMIFEKDIS